ELARTTDKVLLRYPAENAAEVFTGAAAVHLLCAFAPLRETGSVLLRNLRFLVFIKLDPIFPVRLRLIKRAVSSTNDLFISVDIPRERRYAHANGYTAKRLTLPIRE